jgi:hypothetical protein
VSRWLSCSVADLLGMRASVVLLALELMREQRDQARAARRRR